MLLFTGHVSKSRLKSTHTTVGSASDYRTVTLMSQDWIVRNVFAVNKFYITLIGLKRGLFENPKLSLWLYFKITSAFFFIC